MVSLVIVSHSRKVAAAVAELVKALTSESLPIAIAGGVGEDYAELGTDATDIMDAIESVHTDDGTLVLVDMGSAILSTELALDFLGDDVAERVKITAAPVVEGAVAAAVQMGLDAPLETVHSEASVGLQAKQTHLGETDAITSAPTASDIDNLSQHKETLSQQFIIHNAHGLHARPVTRLIHAISPFNCQIGVQNVSKQSNIVDAHSAISVSCLQITKGDTMAVFALGEDAELALKAVEQLYHTHFGESLESTDSASEPFTHQASQHLDSDNSGGKSKVTTKTISLSEGYALALAVKCIERPIHIEKTPTDDVSAECTKLRHAIIAAVASLHQRAKIAGEVESEILSAQAVMLKDPALLDKAVEMIGDEQCVAAYAWNETIQSVSEQYKQMDDSYMQQRASDIIDIGKQVLLTLGAVTDEPIELNEPAILFFSELSPSQATELDPKWVKGIVTERGGSSSHAAIIVRSLGIPAISGFSVANRQAMKDGDFCIIDGYEGRVYCRPDADLRTRYEKIYRDWKTKREQLQQLAQRQAKTQDGVKIDVFANIASLKEAQALATSGADGVGLLRTEFLFLDNADAPSEEVQYERLCEILHAVNKPITIRTFDIGGDKQVPYVNQHEQNPFLGVRGVRLYRQQPELFDAHIRAILRASLGHEVKVMFPMIATLEDFTQSKQRVETIHQELTEQGIAHQWPLPIGMMVETPAAVLLAPELAEVSDFFSIGTNDLTQYVMAADRGAVALADYANPLSTPVLRMLKTVIEAAEHAQIPVGLCGNPGPLSEAVPTLIGLGLRAMSLSQANIPEAKQIISTMSLSS